MPYTLRQLDPTRKLADDVTLDLFAATLPRVTLEAVLTATQAHERRHRRLTMRVVLLLLIAMNLWTHAAIPNVYRQLTRGVRWLRMADTDAEAEAEPLPTRSAFTYRRYQLGVAPVHRLFHTVCQPVATPQTVGAFLFGLRLMAIDGTRENVADTTRNAHYFGRPTNHHGDGAFPQALCVYLVECGTHAIVDAGIWPCHTSERLGGRRMLRSVSAGMLLLWDRGFHDYDLLAAAQRTGAHLLVRAPIHIRPPVVRTLADGTQLVEIHPDRDAARAGAQPLQMRLIRYRLTDPALAKPDEVHFLLTTLLDVEAYPAHTLIVGYHERWEVEITIDEVDTHQRSAYRPFRSQKPVGVIQEFYALLVAHYAIRHVIHDAALAAQVDPDRLSFVLVLQEIQAMVRDFQQVAPCEHAWLYRRLLAECRSTLLPPRRLRVYPRVIKRKVSQFTRKRPEHLGWPQPQQSFVDAICRVTKRGTVIPEAASAPSDAYQPASVLI